LIGMLSAIVDNVPLVAASMGMYDMAANPPDSFLWEFMAYCAGTGGSMLIIGSAAGVAAMGLEKIHFFWYAKKIGGLAALGYFSGILVYIVQFKMLHG
ncbi:MAG: sodium:proton antiporter, partial [Pseudomonadota bacterium]